MGAKAQTWEHLLLFDQHGHDLQLTADTQGIYRGTLHLPVCSTGWPQNAQVLLVEQLYDTVSAQLVLGLPQNAVSTTDPSFFRLSFAEGEWFHAYTVNVQEPSPIITQSAEVDLVLDERVLAGTQVVGSSTYKSVTAFTSAALHLNLLFEAAEEGVYTDTLQVTFHEDSTDTEGTLLLELELRAEAEGEDERFTHLLANLGRELSAQDYYLLRESDVQEPRVDQRLLNRKRKELLLQGHEVYPFVGSYLALRNALTFFGYQDLRVKEYWLNVNSSDVFYLQERQVALPQSYNAANLAERGRLADTDSYRKLGKLGLFYDLNRLTGELDADGLPELEPAFSFTQEEVLLKLLGLKRRLERDFLPLDTYIADITGEQLTFVRYAQRYWTDEAPTRRWQSGREVTVEATRVTYVQDLRPRFLPDYSGVDPGLNGETAPTIKLRSLSNVIGAYLNRLNDTTNLNDQPGIRSGAPVELSTNALADLSWTDLQGLTWAQLAATTTTSGDAYTWAQLAARGVYELEWVISKQADATPAYRDSVRGPASELASTTLYVPYTGAYDVQLRLYDHYNHQTTQQLFNHVEVLPFQVETTFYARQLDPPLRWGDLEGLTWGELPGSWRQPKGTRTKLQELRLTFDDLNIARLNDHGEVFTWQRYRGQTWETFENRTWGSLDVGREHFGVSNFTWERLEGASWADVQQHSWGTLDFQAPRRGAFWLRPLTISAVANPVPSNFFHASGTITIDAGGFQSGDQVQVGVLTVELDTDVALGATDADTAEALVAYLIANNPAITAAHDYAPSTNGTGIITITANAGGTTGNSVTLSVPVGLHVVSGPTLTGGGVKTAATLPVDQFTELWTGAVGEGTPFRFSNTLVTNDWVQIAAELNATDHPVLSRFDYRPLPQSNPTGVYAAAKLGARFGEAQLVIRRLVDNIANVLYYFQDEVLNSNARQGPFAWEELRAWSRPGFELPLFTPLFASVSPTRVPGKTDVRWTVTRHGETEPVGVIEYHHLIWTFTEEGTWDITVELSDANGNRASRTYPGAVTSIRQEVAV